MKSYLVKEDFWIGEIDKGLKAGNTVSYDDTQRILDIAGKKYTVKNLKAAIKAAWLVPVDGELPELDGPVGETAVQEADRKRKDRFEALAKQENESKIAKDDREVARIGGSHNEGTPEYFDALGVEAKPKQRGKFTGEVIEDDTTVVVASIEKSAEVAQIKKAMNQEPKDKKGLKAFEIVDDHFNDGMVHVGKYVDEAKDQALKTWGQLHWKKKAEVIKTASKDFLSKLSKVESSAKMVDRINTRLQEL